jgi:predicted  nucleic acid-binding Zn-ribbon protein
LSIRLAQIETDASSTQEKSGESSTRIRDLRERISQLKIKFTENEVKVQQATDAANTASDLAMEAEEVNQHLLCLLLFGET